MAKKVEIQVNALTGQSAKNIRTVNEALVELAQQAKQRAAYDEAKRAFDAMTQAEKDLLLATKSVHAEQEKSPSMLQKATSSWTEFRSAISVVSEVYNKVQDAVKAVIDPTVQYADQVRELSRATGASADSSSRLIQVADDLFVSYDTLKQSMRKMTAEGLTPNIETLSRLSDEYLKLSPGVERNQFLMKEFGRAGMEMSKIMEVGGEALRGMAAGMDQNMIMTEKNLSSVTKYKQMMDTLNDTIDGYKYKIGNQLIPAILDEIKAQELATEAAKEHNQVFIHGQVVAKDTQGVILDLNNDYVKMAKLMREAVEAGQAVENSNMDIAGSADTVRGKVEDYTDALDTETNTTADAAVVSEQYAGMINEVGTTYDYATMQAGNYANATATATTKTDDLSTAMGELNKQILFEMAAEGMSTEQRWELARSMGLVNETTYGAQQQIAYLKKLQDDGIITMGLYNQAVRDLGSSLGSLPTQIDINVNVHQNGGGVVIQGGQFTTGNSSTSGQLLSNTTTGNPKTYHSVPIFQNGLPVYYYASGGQINPGYPYIVGERGPELFVPSQAGKVVPNQYTHNYNLTINSSANREQIVQDFSMLRSMAGL